MNKNIAISTVFFILGLPLVASAQTTYPPIPQVAPPTVTGPISSVGGTSGSIISLINNILAWFATIFWIAAAMFIFYAAYLYLTAAGDETKVETATHVLRYAAIAIAVGLMSYGLPLLVKNIFNP